MFEIRFKLAVGSYKEEYANELKIIQLQHSSSGASGVDVDSERVSGASAVLDDPAASASFTELSRYVCYVRYY